MASLPLWRGMVAALAVAGCASVTVQPTMRAPEGTPVGVDLYGARLELGLALARRVQLLPAPAAWDTVKVKVNSPRLKMPLVSAPLNTSAASLSVNFMIPVGTASIEALLFQGGASGSLVASGSTMLDLMPGSNVATISLLPMGATLGVLVGSGATGSGGEGSAPEATPLNAPAGVAVHSSGGLVFVEKDMHRIRMRAKQAGTYFGVAMAANRVYTVAGTGAQGWSGDGSSATGATFQFPSAIALDASGSLYVADTDNNVIRKVASSGTISTVAGNGVYGSSVNGYPANTAQMKKPQGILLDASGNLFIADTENNRICMVPSVAGTYFGISMAAGYMYTVAGNGGLGNSGNAGPATSASLNQPRAIALDDGGHLFIADTGNHSVRMVASSAGNYYGQTRVANYIYNVVGTGAPGFSGDGGAAASATLNTPSSLVFDASYTLFIADSLNHRIRRFSTAGTVSTVAGSVAGMGNGLAVVDGKLNFPRGLAVTPDQRVVIADQDNHLIRLLQPDPGGV